MVISTYLCQQPFEIEYSKFDKKLIFKNPTNLYENFCNAYAYYLAVSIRTPSFKKQDIFIKAQEEWKDIRTISNETSSSSSVPFISSSSTIKSEKLPYNATAQKSSIDKQRHAEDQLCELNELQKLKNHAAAQARSQVKKCEALKNRGEVIRYDSLGYLSFLLLNSDLPEQMYSCIKFGNAAKKRRKEVIKTNYSSNAKRHHYPMAIQVNSIFRNEMLDHIDSTINDKSKIPLGIPAVGRTFKTVQSAYEPVEISGKVYAI
ncbi:hypothetical protein C2G38_2202443 [Gigaspora rosea]|uniref:Uncharacterized protein n=1 Tax=Gigaspora rosea TaxID=44941 RepID=A0A397UWB1_9GLOM|nr:hypothetical protein C2G38_2202443 [Gigaspora rosea]